MKKLSFLIALFILAVSVSYAQAPKAKTDAPKQIKILIETEFGNMTAVLYNETPQHRDNFLKLVKQGWYNGSIFHRVIKNFMIQGGGQEAQMNPKKASSGSQFYIVQGQVLNDQQLDMFQKQTNKAISPERRATYKTIGGTPHLDDQYTVFGEVISGLDVIDKIAAVQTAAGDKPVKDVKMKITVIK
jgi:cyclophilin family peptidyl-prolyl cis-trans isomerase